MQVYSKIDFLKRLEERSINLFFEPALTNESLTSWICRNALSSYSDPKQFVSYWLNPHAAVHYDFDHKPIKELNQWIVKYSPKRFSEESVNKDLSSLYPAFKYAKTLLPPVIVNGTRKKQSIYRPQFCPKCLNSNKPYFKLDWKFSMIFGCSNCGCFLATECFYCQNPQQPMKLIFLRKNHFTSINECNFCHNSLSDSKTSLLTKSEIKLNNWITEIIGLKAIESQNPIKASLLLDLCNIISSNNPMGKILREYFGIRIPRQSFTTMNPIQRIVVIKTAKKWIDAFYNTTLDINEKYNITRRNWQSFINLPEGNLHP